MLQETKKFGSEVKETLQQPSSIFKFHTPRERG